MKPSRVIASISALALSGVILGGLLGSERSTPREIVDRTRSSFTNKSLDRRLLLRDLDRALEDPQAATDGSLVEEALILRSELHESMNDFGSAIGDIQVVLTAYRPKDPKLHVRVALLEAKSGNLAGALAKIRLVANNGHPEPSTLRILGELEIAMATESYQTAKLFLDRVLVGADAVVATGALGSLCAMDPLDERRALRADTLRLRIPTGESELVKSVLDQAEAASSHNRAARYALAGALGGEESAASLSALIDLFQRAERPGIAAELTEAARLNPDHAGDARVLQSSLTALIESGRGGAAVEAIRAWNWRGDPPPAEVCSLALSILMEQGEWRQLGAVSNALRGTQAPGSGQTSQFYLALQTSERAELDEQETLWENALKRWNEVIPALDKYVHVPGSVALAHLQRAKTHRALNHQELEREDLLRALTPPRRTDPEEWLRYVSADDYMRMADLSSQLRNTGYRGPEERWTMAMSLAPKRWSELYPRWVELGQASLLQGAGYTFNEVYNAALSSGGAIPSMDVGPQTLHAVGLEHLRRGTSDGAIVVARRLLATYPNLIPAHDMMIEAQLMRGSRVQVMADLLNRMALTGPDPRSAGYLQRIGEDELRPDQQLELMRLDPAVTGRRTVASYALDQGQPEMCILALGPQPEEPAGEDPRLRVLRAEARLQLGDYESVAMTLGGLQSHPTLGAAVSRLELRATSAAEEPDIFSTTLVSGVLDLDATLTEPEAAHDALLDSARYFLDRGLTQEAGTLIHALDARVETRSGAVLEAMTLQALLTGNREGALEALERSEAFFGDGRVELRKLVLSAQAGDWRGVASLSLAARGALGDGGPPWLEAALLLLEERLATGSELAQEGLARNPRSAHWSLIAAAATALLEKVPGSPGPDESSLSKATRSALRGTAGASIDPREVIALLIATDFSGLAMATPQTCSDLRERGAEDLWPGWFEARALQLQGKLDAAIEAYSALVQLEPTFAPAWDALEVCLVARDGAGWGPERLRIRADRNAAGASPPHSEVSGILDRACFQALAGEMAHAIGTLAAPPAGSDETPGVQAMALSAYLHGKTGGALKAIAALQGALPPPGSQSNHPVVEELAQAIIRGSNPKGKSKAILTMGEAKELLVSLVESYPSDPLPPLALCQLKAQAEKRNPALVSEIVARAFESLRERTRGRTLSSLRASAPRNWGDFLLRYSPDTAESFLLQDLASTPGDQQLWHMLARTVEHQGRIEDAASLYGGVANMTNSPAVRLDRAWFMLESGGSSQAVLEELKLAMDSEESDQLDRDQLAFVTAAAQLRFFQDANLNTLVGGLRRLWAGRQGLENVSTTSLGTTYAMALLRRLKDDDRETLVEVLSDLERLRAEDPYTADLAFALGSLQGALKTPSGGRAPRQAKGENRATDDAQPPEEEASEGAKAEAPKAQKEKGSKKKSKKAARERE